MFFVKTRNFAFPAFTVSFVLYCIWKLAHVNVFYTYKFTKDIHVSKLLEFSSAHFQT
jgi:hypothetical protein